MGNIQWMISRNNWRSKTKHTACSVEYHLQSLRDDCTKFVVCHFRNPQPISCPSGLHFSNNKQACDLPKAAGCCETQPYAAGCSEWIEGEKSHNQKQSLRQTAPSPSPSPSPSHSPSPSPSPSPSTSPSPSPSPSPSLPNQNLYGLFKNWLITANTD